MNTLLIYTPDAPDLDALKAEAVASTKTACEACENAGRRSVISGLRLLEVRRAIRAQASGQSADKPTFDLCPRADTPCPQRTKIIFDAENMLPDETFDGWLAKTCPWLKRGTAYRWMECAIGMVSHVLRLEEADMDSVPLTQSRDGQEYRFADLLDGYLGEVNREAKLLRDQCSEVTQQNSLREIAELCPKEKKAALSYDAAAAALAIGHSLEWKNLTRSLAFGQKLQELYADKTRLRPNPKHDQVWYGASSPLDQSHFRWWCKKYLPELNPKDCLAYATAASYFMRYCFQVEDKEQTPISVQEGQFSFYLSAAMEESCVEKPFCRHCRNMGMVECLGHLKGDTDKAISRQRGSFDFWLYDKKTRDLLHETIIRVKVGRPAPLEDFLHTILDEG